MTTTQKPVRAKIAPRYTADSWENDPYLNPSPERAQAAQTAMLESMRARGVAPEALADPETRAKYVEFLKQQRSAE